MKKLLAAAVACVSFAVPSHAFDPEAFALHLRKALSLDSRTEIKVSSAPVPSGIGNLQMVTATIGGSPYPVYITKDEKKYIWGFAVDNTVDPDKDHAQHISLKDVHAQGSATAPITIVEYSDLQCSHCKVAHDVLKKDLYKNYTKEQVRFVFKHFPLSGHDWAEAAAAASECAAMQKESAFWGMTDYFFDNQAQVTKDNVRQKAGEAAKALKLDDAKVVSCMDSAPVLAKVRAQKTEGMAAGVSSTPTLFINGRARRGFRDFDDIKVVIEEKLKEGR